MESLKQSKVIDCHDSAKAESRNDAWDSVIANEVKQSIILAIIKLFRTSHAGFIFSFLPYYPKSFCIHQN